VARAADPVPYPLPYNLQNPSQSHDQTLADRVVAAINNSGRIRDYHIDVIVRAGVVELNGTVTDPVQHEEVVRIVHGVPGVESVLDRVRSNADRPVIVPVQVAIGPQGAPRLPEPAPGDSRPQGPALEGGPGVGAGAPAPEPTPIFQGAAPGPYDFGPPRMPPYAWPTYAPYNNFSRVAVPEAYPYNAWPFIGPMYPFPKIPLGWRSVKLEWDDGYWWFSRVGTKYDWWRLRFY
jgi:hypothetical protein